MSVAARRRKESLRQMFGNQPAYAPPAPLPPIPEWGVSESPDPVVDEIEQRARLVVCDDRERHRTYWRLGGSTPRCWACEVLARVNRDGIDGDGLLAEHLLPIVGSEEVLADILDDLCAQGLVEREVAEYLYHPAQLPDDQPADIEHMGAT